MYVTVYHPSVVASVSYCAQSLLLVFGITTFQMVFLSQNNESELNSCMYACVLVHPSGTFFDFTIVNIYYRTASGYNC